ncbi:MAG: hypothetical protein JNK53_01700, partial [Phycisphaerae bacterium]|nr:hypothetical protein [Phycisphaerae bacterium]
MAGSEPRRKFTQSLMGRLTLAGILPAVLVILTLVTINSTRRYFSLFDALNQRLAGDAETFALRIEAMNRSAVDASRLIALSQEAGMYGDRKETMAYLRQILADTPQFTGTYVVYEPNGDGKDATERIPDATVPAGSVDARGQA